MYEIGSELSVPQQFYRHVGVYVGLGQVFHNHPERGEEITTVGGFANGRAVSVTESGVLEPMAFMARVHAAISNPASYNLLTRNCEHTASWLRTGKAKTPQVWIWGSAAVLTAVALFAAFRTKK
ncbi:C40 family peptidase [Mangrovitalea sediminis]|uniref:hypothetical protein n=1 Tax=Mangrovitalea sediminis TaxID=1982043 RepID=UPI0011784156|nr:hypothetical protein [Mangrovitalea sediminis]